MMEVEQKMACRRNPNAGQPRLVSKRILKGLLNVSFVCTHVYYRNIDKPTVEQAFWKFFYFPVTNVTMYASYFLPAYASGVETMAPPWIFIHGIDEVEGALVFSVALSLNIFLPTPLPAN